MTTASGRDPAPRGDGQERSVTGPVGSFVVRRARLVLVAALLAVVGFGVLGVGAFGKLQTGGFDDPGAQSTIAQTLTDRATEALVGQRLRDRRLGAWVLEAAGLQLAERAQPEHTKPDHGQ